MDAQSIDGQEPIPVAEHADITAFIQRVECTFLRTIPWDVAYLLEPLESHHNSLEELTSALDYAYSSSERDIEVARADSMKLCDIAEALASQGRLIDSEKALPESLARSLKMVTRYLDVMQAVMYPAASVSDARERLASIAMREHQIGITCVCTYTTLLFSFLGDGTIASWTMASAVALVLVTFYIAGWSTKWSLGAHGCIITSFATLMLSLTILVTIALVAWKYLDKILRWLSY